MNTRRTAWTVIVAALVLVGGCAKDEGPRYVPLPRPADPTQPMDTVHFSSEVLPIFEAHCWVCHPPMGNGMDLSPTNAYNELVNVTSANWAPAMRVVPGDPEASVLWNKVTFSEVYGLGMPPSGAALTMQDLETIRIWIEQGALNN